MICEESKTTNKEEKKKKRGYRIKTLQGFDSETREGERYVTEPLTTVVQGIYICSTYTTVKGLYIEVRSGKRTRGVKT